MLALTSRVTESWGIIFSDALIEKGKGTASRVAAR
jgi:hypothetical protein